jgi:hypothetical protein
LIPSPILKALSTIRKNNVQCLLMGGQACILYGAAEFSRDADLAVLADNNNLEKLQCAVVDLEAAVIAVPPFERQYLDRGHAIHFRCKHPDANGVRLDIMSVMRGVERFGLIWDRRTTVSIGDEQIDVLGLPDLIAAKKTQRDKDWPMIRRLVDVNYLENRGCETSELLSFWMNELRSPETLRQVVEQHAEAASQVDRQVVKRILAGADDGDLSADLLSEEQAVRQADKEYWEPLKRELSALRRGGYPSNFT